MMPRSALVLCIVMAALSVQAQAQAQAPLTGESAPLQSGPRPASGIVTLDQDVLFQSSRFGRRILSVFETGSRALAAENRTIEADLEAEEKDLTAKRANLPAADFRELADAFDAKVVELRRAQDGKLRKLVNDRDAAQQRFFQATVPVLTDLLTEVGALAIIDSDAIFLSSERIDITAEAVAQIDAVLGDGTGGPPGAPAPMPEPATP